MHNTHTAVQMSLQAGITNIISQGQSNIRVGSATTLTFAAVPLCIMQLRQGLTTVP